MYDRSKCEIICMQQEFDYIGMHEGIKPIYSTKEAAAADVAIPFDVTIPAKKCVYVDLLLRTNIGLGYCLLMFPRSSLLMKYSIIMPVSVIDSDYKLNIHAPLYNPTESDIYLEKGTRIAQVMLQDCSIRVTNNFSDKVRDGGCGSTGV